VLTELFTALSDYIIVIALSATRIAIAFMLLPLFSTETVPALVRNAIFLALALIAVVVQPELPTETVSTALWINLFVKEVFIGIVIGVQFGVFLWAFEAAGVVIDTQIGTSFAMLFDPIAGNEVTLFGELLGRWANYMFVAAGGLLVLAGVMLESFAIWPLLQPAGGLRELTVSLFEAELSRFMTLTIMIAGPVMVVIFLIDISMGLINRFAQQFNVFFLSTSIKSMAALLLIAMLLPFLVDKLLGEIDMQAVRVELWLSRILLQ
jgi:type III secretion protein T